MHLICDVPTSWERRAAPGRDLYVVSSEPWLSVEIGPLVEASELPEDLLTIGLLPDLRLTARRELQHSTETGWPLHLQEALVCDPSGAVVQVRLMAAYTFLVYATAVLVCAANVELFESYRPAIVRFLEGARPSLRGGPVAAIADLWSMEGAP